MARAIMFLGTGSDVGKSIAATAFCRIMMKKGYRVSPFKAQNMSNNAFVTVEGGEIGRAQAVQAEAAGVAPSIHMNPILLKPTDGMGAQIIIQGKAIGRMDAMEYHERKKKLTRVLMESYDRLAGKNDFIVLEGAGSCCEMNIKQNDLVNFRMAKSVGAPCIVVADIDKGGVFAQTIGTFHLMTREEKGLTMGFLINKFRGDPRLFSSGIEYIEQKTGLPVLGLVPFYEHIRIDSEDSVAVQEDKRPLAPVGPGTVNVAVLRVPAISNFTDIEILEREADVVVNYLSRSNDLSDDYDCLILPGTKNVMEDAVWMQRRGWKKAIMAFQNRGGRILGLCGGYQLLGRKIRDPLGVESKRMKVDGLGLLPVDTELQEEKVLREVTGICLLNGKRVRGYEIHMGRSRVLGSIGKPFLRIHMPGEKKFREDGWATDDGLIAGTYLHGLLDAPGFRGEFLNSLRRAKGLREKSVRQGGSSQRLREYDKLSDHFEAHCDVEKILSLVL